jgi:hypothetical protein|tara:strand:- start:530 stop:799 length:270 start_codon:yes stop_codon:yes gene_type:complete
MRQEKVFFHEGDVVELKQNIPNKPTMIVGSVVKSTRVQEKDSDTDRSSKSKLSYIKPVLMGVRCYWFTTSLEIQEKTFNTKDLIKVDTE